MPAAGPIGPPAATIARESTGSVACCVIAFVVRASRLHLTQPTRPSRSSLVQARRLHHNRRRKSGVGQPTDWQVSIVRGSSLRCARPRGRIAPVFHPPSRAPATWSSAVRPGPAGSPRIALLRSRRRGGRSQRVTFIVNGIGLPPSTVHSRGVTFHPSTIKCGIALPSNFVRNRTVKSRCWPGIRFKALSLQKDGSNSSP